MSNTSNLYRLQQIDTNLDQTRSRLAEIDRILSDDTAMQAAEAEQRNVESEFRAAQKELQAIEYQAQEQRTKIEQDESSLYSGRIRSPKELQDLQNEVASLKRFLEVLEDRQLDAMLLVEEWEEKLTDATQTVNQVRGRFEEEHAHLRAEKTTLQQNLHRFEIERQAAAGSIPQQDLDLYDQLRKIRNGIAISRIVDRSCASCGSTLTPGLAQSASLPNQIVRCPSCGRILFAS